MTSRIEQLKARANAVAQTAEDMNEATGSGGRLLPGKAYLGRLCEYVDLGLQPEEYEGQAKDPAPNIRLGVALFGPDASDPVTGAPYVLRSSNISIKRNEKATAFKAFKALNFKNDPNIKHFSQFLGDAFIFQVALKTSQKTKRQYNTIEWDKTQAPINPVDGSIYAVPALDDKLYRVFLWDDPTKEDWDSLFIEGAKDDGTTKNFIQEQVLGALNFEGSPLQVMLGGAGAAAVQELPQGNVAQPGAAVAQAVTPAAPVVAPVATVGEVVQPATVVTPQVADPLVQPAQSVEVVQPSVGVTAAANVSTQSSPSEAPVVAPVLAPNLALPVIPGQA